MAMFFAIPACAATYTIKHDDMIVAQNSINYDSPSFHHVPGPLGGNMIKDTK